MTDTELARYTMRLIEAVAVPPLNKAQQNELFSEREEHKNELARLKAAYETQLSFERAQHNEEVAKLQAILDIYEGKYDKHPRASQQKVKTG